MMTENSVTDGALLFYCYGEFAAISAVHHHLLQTAAWEQQGDSHWLVDSAACQLFPNLPAFDETACLQIAINRQGIAVLAGWENARTQLEAWLPTPLLANEGIVGTTLIYQADCEGALLDADVKVARPLTEAAQMLHGVTDRRISVSGEVLGAFGRISHLPTHEKQMVYLFLSGRNNEALSEWLMQPSNLFLSAEAITHHGYKAHRRFQQQTMTLTPLIASLRAEMPSLIDGPATPLWEALHAEYQQALLLLPVLESAIQSMEIMGCNLGLLGESEARWLWAYHRQQVEIARTSADYALKEAHTVLQSVQTALSWYKKENSAVQLGQQAVYVHGDVYGSIVTGDMVTVSTITDKLKGE